VETRKQIENKLEKEFSRSRVIKCQVQWTGSKTELEKSIRDKKASAAVKTRYELIVKGRKDKQVAYYEVLCESNGNVVSMRDIIQRNSDNLIY
jgi:hypothetical protein